MNDPDVAFPTIQKPRSLRKRNQPRKLTRFERWAWSPIVSFQVGLTAGYIALMWFGISSWLANPPALVATTPEDYAGFWALSLLIGSAIAAVGSIHHSRAFEHLERVGSTVVSGTVGSYTAILTWIAYAHGDLERLSGAAGFIALSVPLIIRTMWLWSQLFRK